MTKTFTLSVAAALIVAPLAYAQDKETEEQIREATEAAKKMGVQMPDVKKMMEEDAQEEAKEKEKAKTNVQAALNAPGRRLPGLDTKDPGVHSRRTNRQKGCR